MKVLAVIGTRPEAIKMAPVVQALRTLAGVSCMVCSTGQHRRLVGEVLGLFGIQVDVDLQAMRDGQSLNELVGGLVNSLDVTLADFRPDRVLVHGDTSTALAGALAAFNRGMPVAHVEAGLRSFNPQRPWPEEMNRRLVDTMSDLLFAPTVREKNNLRAEHAPGQILVTGNTGIDALLATAGRLRTDDDLRSQADKSLPALGQGRRLLLVTAHRRENFGGGIAGICEAVRSLSRRPNIDIAYVLHPNPAAREAPLRLLQGAANIHLLPAMDYLSFVRLLQRADLVITDSGGLQEEAPVLGKAVLVTRTETERRAAQPAGSVRLVGVNASSIEAAAEELLDDPNTNRWASHLTSPYGDGRASERISHALLGLPIEEFRPPTGRETPADLEPPLARSPAPDEEFPAWRSSL